MRIQSIRTHLAPFSILGKRRTTIAHAFASAIAPTDAFEEQEVRRALHMLGQDEADIRCVYCGNMAETWDHLVGLVKGGRFSGFGHVLGNLVPSCKSCNSRKGNSDWRKFLRGVSSGDSFDERLTRIAAYQQAYNVPDLSYERIKAMAPSETAEYELLHDRVLELLSQADHVAERIRRKQRKFGDF